MPVTATTRFTGGAETPAAARRFVATHLKRVARLPFADVLTILSELATNAVQAGATMIEVQVEADDGFTRIAVTDDAAGWPKPRLAGPMDVSGRGLMIVEALATRWGVTATSVVGTGKQVWAVLTH
jgi:anti-sigma regulatory factor (Ser/Thr protein kinase)